MSPEDIYGWASAGIYCFWDIQTRQPLYIGLAVDLGSHFQQHNGLKQCDPRGCKLQRIQQYFSEYEAIGYSVLVQILSTSQSLPAMRSAMTRWMIPTSWNRSSWLMRGGSESSLRKAELSKPA